ncbi:MAG TPA: chorismate mutase [Syntrophomonadaceae bacterium]|nr:chorismate mutase [Syntrophomonadaceae bacterium]
MVLRGIRGAITVKEDNRLEILGSTKELLEQIQQANSLNPEDIASIFFTVTKDLTTAFPAEAARNLGWDLVPLLCFQEIEVIDSLPFCIRVLILFNTNKEQNEIKHIYLRNAECLRKDLKT